MQSSYSVDSIYRREIKILQPAKGYRFAVDAVLLAHFLETKSTDNILEIGSGSGVITILLSAMQQFRSGTVVEIQSELAKLCLKNFEANDVKNVAVVEGDMNELTFEQYSFDLIYSNPPYRKAGSGKLNPSEQKAIARHEIKLKLEDLFRCSKKLLKPDGRFSIILPVYREKDFMRLAQTYEMHLVKRRYVHSFENEAAAFLLATVSSCESEFQEVSRIVIYKKPGQYTDQMKKLL